MKLNIKILEIFPCNYITKYIKWQNLHKNETFLENLKNVLSYWLFSNGS